MNKINKENIEAYLLDFVEERLTKEEEKELLAYLEVHTEYKSMLEEYDKDLILKEDKQIVFENKNILKYRPTLYYRKRIIYIASSVAAVLLLLFLLQPMKNNVVDTQKCNNISLAKQNVYEPCNNNVMVIDSSSKQESEIKQNNFFPLAKEKKTIKKEEVIFQQENFTTEQVVSSIKEDNVVILDSGIINNNTLMAQEPVLNDTIYIIYAGSKKDNNLQRVADYVEKHTNWNMMQTVSSIKEMVEDVKEKYFSF